MEEVDAHGVKVFIDPKALMFLLGTEMDFVNDRLRAEFVFRNPNSKGMRPQASTSLPLSRHRYRNGFSKNPATAGLLQVNVAVENRLISERCA